MSFRVAVLGASGYAGGELIRLIDGHDGFDLVYMGAHSHAGSVLGDVHPQLKKPERPLGGIDAEIDADLVFLALPHGASAKVGFRLTERGLRVVDLGSDFRLDTPERFEEAYGEAHPLPDQLGRWVYGLPELFDCTGADRVASPGCYPTAVLLAIAPFLRKGLVSADGLVADCLSGVSGAGRSLRDEFMFGSVAEGVRAYGIAGHRHRPEIEMALDSLLGGRHRVTFTPHLVPMQRGLLATVTAAVVEDSDGIEDCLSLAYQDAPFVEVIDRPPQTRWVVGSNRALVAAFHDGHTGRLIAQCAIDNLLKGAAGQAVQAANLMVGYEETTGLPLDGLMP